MPEPKLPEGPQTPAWLQMLQWALNPLKFLETCARDYGDIFTTNIGFNAKSQVIISNPQGIQELFTTDPKKLDAGNPKLLEADSGERYNRNFLGGLVRRTLLLAPSENLRMVVKVKRSQNQRVLETSSS